LSEEYGLQGLNGNEIIDDLVAQFRKRLQGDCSLRPQDRYSRGYSAKIIYHVECYGLDKETVDGEFETGKPQVDDEAEIDEGVVEIPQEEDLHEVRHRIGQASKREAGGPNDGEGEGEDASGSPVTATKRKYTRKLKLASPGVIGGAEEFTE
jgi:hypothetical protein